MFENWVPVNPSDAGPTVLRFIGCSKSSYIT